MNAFVTTRQAAERLGVSDSRIRQLILDGKLAAVKAGRDWLIKASDLRLMEKRKTKPGPAAKAVSKAASKRAARTRAIKKREKVQ
jgi:excisionase family DNA binding protein